MPVEMELRRIIISEIHEQQVIILKELDGERSFSIQIGIFEATSIDRKIKKIPSPRPLTHDLLCQTIHSLGGELQEIQITQLKEKTYFATLKIGQNGRVVEVDCRPSDAIALALRSGAPILANQDLLSEAGIEIPDQAEDEVEKFKEFLDQIKPEDFAG
ncbi:bifunctional nuclease family protein [bacterium]|nr:bifunctional nuclease family protein [bacterium]